MKNKMAQPLITEYFQLQKPKEVGKREKSYKIVTFSDLSDSSDVETVESPRSDEQNLPREKSKEKQDSIDELLSWNIINYRPDDESSLDSNSVTNYDDDSSEDDDGEPLHMDYDMEASQGLYRDPLQTPDSQLFMEIIAETEYEIEYFIENMIDRMSILRCDSQSDEKRADLIDAFVKSVQKKCTSVQKLFGKKPTKKSTSKSVKKACVSSNSDGNASKNFTPHSLDNKPRIVSLNGDTSQKSTPDSVGNELLDLDDASTISVSSSVRNELFKVSDASTKPLPYSLRDGLFNFNDASKKFFPYSMENRRFNSNRNGNMSKKPAPRTVGNERYNSNLNGYASKKSTLHSVGNERPSYSSNSFGNVSNKFPPYSVENELFNGNASKKSTLHPVGYERSTSNLKGNASKKSTPHSVKNVHFSSDVYGNKNPLNTSYNYPYSLYSNFFPCYHPLLYTAPFPNPSYFNHVGSMMQMPSLSQTFQNLSLAEDLKRYEKHLMGNNSGSHNYYYETI